MISILLTRHAQSKWNQQRRWQGQADIELSDLGLQQAHAAADFIVSAPSDLGLDFDAVATSSLQRASVTGNVIAARLGLDIPVRSAGISERNVGQWSGLTREEIDVQYPDYLKDNRRPPGWESDEAFSKRVLDGLCDICGQLPKAKSIIVIAHGGVIYNLEQRLGLTFNRITNLGSRWIYFDSETREYQLGGRLDLLADFDCTI